MSVAPIPAIVRRILEDRGVSAAELESFLDPSLRDLASPRGLPGVAEAAETVLGAVRAHRQIVVFGDYDCDGVCATAIMAQVISAVGGDVRTFLPERLSEGYGMTDASVRRMREANSISSTFEASSVLPSNAIRM